MGDPCESVIAAFTDTMAAAAAITEELAKAAELAEPPEERLPPDQAWASIRARHSPPATWPGRNGRGRPAPWRKAINLARRCGR